MENIQFVLWNGSEVKKFLDLQDVKEYLTLNEYGWVLRIDGIAEPIWCYEDMPFDSWMKEHPKQCGCCKKIMPKSFFNKKTSAKDGYQGCCKKCQSAAASKSYFKRKQRNRDHIETIVHDGKILTKVWAHPELADISARKLMEELKARGYRWDYMLEPQRKIPFGKI